MNVLSPTELSGRTPPATACALTIGNFDGVHTGHQRLISTLAGVARARGLRAVVLTFEPHPLSVLLPARTPGRLTTHAERAALLRAHGASEVIALRSDAELFNLSADEFLQRCVRPLRPACILEGPAFRFGKDRGGSLDTLRAAGERDGYEVQVVDSVLCGGIDGRPVVSSSAVRDALRDGRVDSAALLLGRPHRSVGRVGSGAQRGTALGFPTANLDEIVQIVPAFGVYAALAQVEDGTLYVAVVNVGPQPTFGEERPRVEAHLVNFAGSLRGARLGLWWVARLRGQVRFADAEQLAAQIARDKSQALAICGERIAAAAHLALPLEL